MNISGGRRLQEGTNESVNARWQCALDPEEVMLCTKYKVQSKLTYSYVHLRSADRDSYSMEVALIDQRHGRV